ncbi:MAG: hypothetical protein U1E65_16950 [Myxococcota bacterium]
MRRPNQTRGFALIVVVMLSAALAMGGAILLDVVRVDLLLGRTGRQTEEARQVAEGAVMEAINDQDTPNQLPPLDDSDLTRAYQPTSATPFAVRDRGLSYDAQFRLIRVVPLAESSMNQTRAIVHEIAATGNAGNGETAVDVRTEIYRVVAFQPGTVLPRRHAH